MDIRTVLVFGATGVQGQAQFRELIAQGYIPVVASRRRDALVGSEFANLELRQVDYEAVPSLIKALEGIDAVFFQAPAMGDIGRLHRHARHLAAAIAGSGVKLTVVNTSMWSPDEACGDPHYDSIRAMEKIFEAELERLIILRPTVFMNNLLGDWIKPILVNEGRFRYNHGTEMEANWLCLEDMAKFMVASLKRSDLVGRRLQVGGPQRLKTDETVAILSDAIGHQIRHQYITPREFAEHYWGLHGHESGLEHETFVDYFAKFHAFNNDAPERPFQSDPAQVKALFPEVETVDLKTWAKAQDWRA